MGALDVIGGIGAIILALELVVFVLVFAAICVGLVFGLRFGQSKTEKAFRKVNDLTAKAVKVRRRSLLMAGKPFVVVSASLSAAAAAGKYVTERITR